MAPPRVTRAWIRHRDQIGLSQVRWHDLRHINASELIAAGVDPKTSAERLGHDPAMLLTRYAHARLARDQVAADVIAAADNKATKAATKATTENKPAKTAGQGKGASRGGRNPR